MNRTVFFVADVFSASSLLLVDSAVKGTALLALAAALAIILRRDSAATRHLVWLLAIVALLAVPLLSAMLPQWRVLPEWASIRPATAEVAASLPSLARPAVDAVQLPRNEGPVDVESPAAPIFQPAATLPDSRLAPATIEAIPAPSVGSWNWQSTLPLAWTIGCSMLVLRLLAARWMLWNVERQGTVIWSTSQPAKGQPAKATHDPLVTALEAVCLQLGMRHPVTLMIHPDKTIPVVWGILHYRLLLPAAARQWSGEQLRSVLLHELAHIKRRDTIVQLLTQIACALHWFNPLVWVASWRLGVERERACDDLVLASGVRPSAYAGHLLEVVTELSTIRWTQSCGLAMARGSSLEGRLAAVLSKNLNRRGVSVALAAIALAIAVGIAVPIAMLCAADEKPGEKPKSTTAATKPKGGEKLQPAVKEKLIWGKPVNGLRAALVIRKSPDEPNAADTPDLYLLVQNVSDAPIHLNDTAGAPNVRYLTLQRDDLPQGRTKLDKPTGTDALLQPREATFLRMVPRGASRGQNLAAGMLKEPHMILFGQMNIEKAPAGAWTGKLVTGYTDGAGAQIDSPAAPAAPGAPAGKQPKQGANLQPGQEEKLKWGEPVNGLRAAIVIRHPDKPKGAGELPDLYLVMQNVSKAPIRLTDVDVPPKVNLRVMYPKKDGRIMAGLGAREPALGDHLLQPREVAFLPMFDPDTKATKTGDPSVDGRTIGAFFAESLMKDARQTMFAEIEIDKAPEGAWTGKLVTGDTTGAAAAGLPQPKGKEAQSLFRVWQNGARASGKIPGGALEPLARTAEKFIRLNPTHEAAPKLAELLKRIDTSHDWTREDAIALLDDVTAIYATLPSWVEDEPRFSLGGAIQTGQPLPAELKNSPWGEAQPDGLRVAWLLEPQGAEQRLGTPLKSRILFHNAGKNVVMFRALTWNQSGAHKARDAKGAEINITAVEWTTIPRIIACRLASGEFLEVTAAGIGVGTDKEVDNRREIGVGAWVEAKVGDEVTFTPAPVSATGNFTDERAKGEPGWWLDFIKDRLSQDSPLPADVAERERLLTRAVRDLFGTAPTPKETAAFVADRAPNAFDSLAKRLAQRAGTSTYTGTLQSAPTKFRVLPADPDANKKPRVTTGPGRYNLGNNIYLTITQKPDGERRVNVANIQFPAPDPQSDPPAKPYEIKLPDGHLTWSIAWEPGTTILWVLEKGIVRSYDFANPAQVKETTLKEFVKAIEVPKPVLDALRTAFDAPPALSPAPATPK
jgi:hypothetical protein